jgi:hypothetical protein
MNDYCIMNGYLIAIALRWSTTVLNRSSETVSLSLSCASAHTQFLNYFFVGKISIFSLSLPSRRAAGGMILKEGNE